MHITFRTVYFINCLIFLIYVENFSKVASANAIDKCVCENKMAADICVAKFQGAAMKASSEWMIIDYKYGHS